MREEPAVYLLGGFLRKACLRQQPLHIRVMQYPEKFFVIYGTRAPAAAVPFIIHQPAAEPGGERPVSARRYPPEAVALRRRRREAHLDAGRLPAAAPQRREAGGHLRLRMAAVASPEEQAARRGDILQRNIGDAEAAGRFFKPRRADGGAEGAFGFREAAEGGVEGGDQLFGKGHGARAGE